MPLTALVAEDIPATREAICKRIQQHPEIDVTKDFDNVDDTIDYLLNNELPDVLFLDVRLKTDDAWEIIEQLREYQIIVPPVVLITAEQEKGYAAIILRKYKEEVVDYFVKPFGQGWRERRNECVEKIKARLSAIKKMESTLYPPATHLEINEGNSSKILTVDDITHAIRIGQPSEDFPLAGLYIFTISQTEPLYGQQYKALNQLARKLSSDDFIRGHRDNLINKQHISGFILRGRQEYAVVGPFDIKVPLSKDGESRLRKGLGV